MPPPRGKLVAAPPSSQYIVPAQPPSFAALAVATLAVLAAAAQRPFPYLHRSRLHRSRSRLPPFARTSHSFFTTARDGASLWRIAVCFPTARKWLGDPPASFCFALPSLQRGAYSLPLSWAPTARPFGRLGAVLGAGESASVAPASAPSWALPSSAAVRSVRSGRRLAEGVAEGAACTPPVASALSLRDPILRRLT